MKFFHRPFKKASPTASAFRKARASHIVTARGSAPCKRYVARPASAWHRCALWSRQVQLSSGTSRSWFHTHMVAGLCAAWVRWNQSRKGQIFDATGRGSCAVLEHMHRALTRHDAVSNCFPPTPESRNPAHPDRQFGGRDRCGKPGKSRRGASSRGCMIHHCSSNAVRARSATAGLASRRATATSYAVCPRGGERHPSWDRSGTRCRFQARKSKGHLHRWPRTPR